SRPDQCDHGHTPLPRLRSVPARRFLAATLAPLLALALVASACSQDGSGSDGAGSGSGNGNGDAAAQEAGDDRGRCPEVDPASCLLPWPNDDLTRVDPDSPTGRRVDIPTDGTPANVGGTHIDPAEWNRNDGFSPAAVGLAVVPNLDPVASGLPTQGDIGASTEPGAVLAVVD